MLLLMRIQLPKRRNFNEIGKYTGKKHMHSLMGGRGTLDELVKQFPVILDFVHVITIDDGGQVCLVVENLSAMRMRFGIDSSLTEDEAIAAIEEIINTPVEVSTEATNEDITASSLASIAASLEYQNMMTLEDVEEV